MLKKIIFLCLFMFVTACNVPTQQAYRDGLQPFIGHHIDTLVRQWGPAQNTHRLADGSMIYQWQRGSTDVYHVSESLPVSPLGGYYAPYGSWGWGAPFGYGYMSSLYVSHPIYVQHECTTRITTDTQKIIREIMFEGDDCVAYSPSQAR